MPVSQGDGRVGCFGSHFEALQTEEARAQIRFTHGPHSGPTDAEIFSLMGKLSNANASHQGI
jgi:hypothetical protein